MPHVTQEALARYYGTFDHPGIDLQSRNFAGFGLTFRCIYGWRINNPDSYNSPNNNDTRSDTHTWHAAWSQTRSVARWNDRSGAIRAAAGIDRTL